MLAGCAAPVQPAGDVSVLGVDSFAHYSAENGQTIELRVAGNHRALNQYGEWIDGILVKYVLRGGERQYSYDAVVDRAGFLILTMQSACGRGQDCPLVGASFSDRLPTIFSHRISRGQHCEEVQSQGSFRYDSFAPFVILPSAGRFCSKPWPEAVEVGGRRFLLIESTLGNPTGAFELPSASQSPLASSLPFVDWRPPLPPFPEPSQDFPLSEAHEWVMQNDVEARALVENRGILVETQTLGSGSTSASSDVEIHRSAGRTLAYQATDGRVVSFQLSKTTYLATGVSQIALTERNVGHEGLRMAFEELPRRMVPQASAGQLAQSILTGDVEGFDILTSVPASTGLQGTRSEFLYQVRLRPSDLPQGAVVSYIPNMAIISSSSGEIYYAIGNRERFIQ